MLCSLPNMTGKVFTPGQRGVAFGAVGGCGGGRGWMGELGEDPW